MGGIGNQMFQYALYESLRRNGKKVKIDSVAVNDNNIFDIYDIEVQYATQEELDVYDDFSLNLVARIKRKLGWIKGNVYIEDKEQWGKYNEALYDLDDVYLFGYWQNEGYFRDFADELINAYSNPKKLHSDTYIENLRCIEDIENSVSLHVRLGDYVSHKTLGGICDEEYYEKCIKYILEKRRDAKVFVFSNEIKEAMKMNCLKTIESTPIYSKSGYDWEDMLLMSKCKDNIVANSTFSWWGAWLNQNANKIVVAPKKWMRKIDMNDIVPPKWVRI